MNTALAQRSVANRTDPAWQALVAELEELREECRQLRERLGLNETGLSLMRVQETFRCSKGQGRILLALLKSSTGTHEDLYERYNDLGLRSDPDPKIIGVQVMHLLRKLRPFGIEVENIWGTGYRLAPEAKARVRTLLAEDADG